MIASYFDKRNSLHMNNQVEFTYNTTTHKFFPKVVYDVGFYFSVLYVSPMSAVTCSRREFGAIFTGIRAVTCSRRGGRIWCNFNGIRAVTGGRSGVVTA